MSCEVETSRCVTVRRCPGFPHFASLGMTRMKKLTHIGSDGRAQMVDVSAKPLSQRRAAARGSIRLQRKTVELIARDQIAKGNVFVTARIAGIQAAKQTAQ